MKRLLLIAAISLLQQTEPERPLTNSIDGVVKHSGTDFISNVVVSLIPESGMPLTSTTDEKGRFAFKNVAAGTFRLQAQRDGYIRALKGSGPQTLTVAGQDIHDVELNLILLGTIRGRIMDNAGQPLKGIQVSAVIIGYNNGRESPITIVGTEIRPLSDERGEYRLSGFIPGEYFIKAETPPSVGALAPPKMVSFFPGTLNAKEAVPVRLHEGEELTGIDFKLQAPDTRFLHSISGKVILPVETLGSGSVGNFYLFPKDRQAGVDGNGFTILATNRAEGMSNGNFLLGDVPPGQYDVIAALTRGPQREYRGVEVQVGDKDVDGVTIPLARKFEVKGRVIVDGAAGSLARESLQITLVPEFHLGSYSSPVDPNGSFSFKDIAEGKYSVSIADLPANAYIADIRQNSKSIFSGITSFDDAVIEVNSQSSTDSSLEVIVSSGGGTVTITVQDAKSAVVSDAAVALVPEASRRQTLMWFKPGFSDERGRITFNGVAPGYYKIFAWERPPLRAWQSEDFLREFETQGKFVHVDSPGRLDATVNIIPNDDNHPPRTFKTGISFSPAPADQTFQTASSTSIQSNPNYATVEGKVTRLKTGGPIPGIPVYIGDKATQSGPDGHYIIYDVPPGTYSLSMANAERLGFFAPAQRGVPGSVTVNAKQHIDDLNFKLSAGGKVSGHVFDINGQPVKNALMQLEGPDYIYSKHYLLSTSSTNRTDDHGEYHISGIGPGEYYLRVRPGSGGPLATTYFPGTLDLARARVVVIKEDEEIPGMDIIAQPASGNRVSGKLLPPANADVPASTSFYLVPRDNSMAEMMDLSVQPTRSSTGEFEILNVLRGSYDLFVLATSGRGSGQFGVPDSAYTARTRIDVGNQDVLGVTTELHPTVDIRGRVVIEGNGNAIKPDSVHVYPVAEDFGPSATWLLESSRVDAAGQFVFPKALPLRYTFSVESIPENAYLADVRQGTTSILDTGLRLGDKAPEPIEVVINPAGAHLDGIVRDRDNNGIAFTTVVLVPEGLRRGVSSFYKTAVTDDVGKFTIRGIAPGEYKLFAWESSPARAWRDPEFMAPFEEFGTPVHIEPATHIENTAVRLIPKLQ